MTTDSTLAGAGGNISRPFFLFANEKFLLYLHQGLIGPFIMGVSPSEGFSVLIFLSIKLLLYLQRGFRS